MKYCIDVAALSVEKYRDLLKKQNLLPGRRILLQDIDLRFKKIMNANIKNVFELKKVLSSPNKLKLLATENDLSEEYLIILKREIGCFEQKPVPINNFPGIDDSLISLLNNNGIKTSKEYWESTLPKEKELYSLCDLVRINGVGPVAAKAFYEAGYTSVEDVANGNSHDMLNRVTLVNEKKEYYKAKLGVRDMQFCIDFAIMLNSFA